MSERFEWDDTNSSGIWWSTNVSIRDECILLKEDTQCEDSDIVELLRSCLLYTSDAADDLLCVDLGGRRIIKKNFLFNKRDI